MAEGSGHLVDSNDIPVNYNSETWSPRGHRVCGDREPGPSRCLGLLGPGNGGGEDIGSSLWGHRVSPAPYFLPPGLEGLISLLFVFLLTKLGVVNMDWRICRCSLTCILIKPS